MISASSISKAIKKEPKIYTCSVCQQTFNHDRKLYLHKKKEHPQKSSFSCDTSYKFFSSRPGVRTIGSGKFTCNICKQFYSSKALLSKHEKIHVRYGGKSVSSQGNQLMSSSKRPLQKKPDVKSNKKSYLAQGTNTMEKKTDGISKQYSSLGHGLGRIIKKSENARELYGNLSGSKDCYDIDFSDQQSTTPFEPDKRNIDLPKKLNTEDKKIEDEILVDHFMIEEETVKIKNDPDGTLFMVEPNTVVNEIIHNPTEHMNVQRPFSSFEGLKEFFPDQNVVQVSTPELQITPEKAEIFTPAYLPDLLGNSTLEHKNKLENGKQSSNFQPREKRSYFIGDLLKKENDSNLSTQNQAKCDNKYEGAIDQASSNHPNKKIKTELESQVTPIFKILTSEENIVDTFYCEQSPQEKVPLLFKAEQNQAQEIVPAPLNAADDKESVLKWYGKDLSKKDAEKLAKLACRMNAQEIKREEIVQTNNPPKLCENQKIAKEETVNPLQDGAVNPLQDEAVDPSPGPNLQNISVTDALKFFSS